MSKMKNMIKVLILMLCLLLFTPLTVGAESETKYDVLNDLYDMYSAQGDKETIEFLKSIGVSAYSNFNFPNIEIGFDKAIIWYSLNTDKSISKIDKPNYFVPLYSDSVIFGHVRMIYSQNDNQYHIVGNALHTSMEEFKEEKMVHFLQGVDTRENLERKLKEENIEPAEKYVFLYGREDWLGNEIYFKSEDKAYIYSTSLELYHEEIKDHEIYTLEDYRAKKAPYEKELSEKNNTGGLKGLGAGIIVVGVLAVIAVAAAIVIVNVRKKK